MLKKHPDMMAFIFPADSFPNSHPGDVPCSISVFCPCVAICSVPLVTSMSRALFSAVSVGQPVLPFALSGRVPLSAPEVFHVPSLRCPCPILAVPPSYPRGNPNLSRWSRLSSPSGVPHPITGYFLSYHGGVPCPVPAILPGGLSRPLPPQGCDSRCGRSAVSDAAAAAAGSAAGGSLPARGVRRPGQP